MTGHSAGGHRVRAGQIHLAGTAAARKIAVLGADRDLVGAGGDGRSSVGAGAATGVYHDRARLMEDVKVAPANAVFPSLLPAELNIKFVGVSHTLASLE